MRFLKIKLIFLIYIFFISHNAKSEERWILDKELSEIKFELPVFLAKNVKGKFNEFEGYVILDLEKKKNNRAIFSVKIDSIEINYNKYRNLLMSEIFFEEKNFPIALIDTKKFIFNKEKNILIDGNLQIKQFINPQPLSLELIYLTNNLVQLKGFLEFSRTSFEIGKKNWSSTAVLKDNILVNVNLFLKKE